MVRLQSPVVVKEVELDASPEHPDAAPMFYCVPSPGVKCYTFEYREALQKRIERWAAREGVNQEK